MTAALRGIDLDKLRRGEISFESKLSSEQAGSLLVLLGLDGAILAGNGPGQFQGSVNGAWGEQKELDKLLQMYAVEKARIEARKAGHQVVEQALSDGSIKITITVQGGAA